MFQEYPFDCPFDYATLTMALLVYLAATFIFVAPTAALTPRTKLTLGTVAVPLPNKIPYSASDPLHFVLPNFTEPDPHTLRAVDFLRAHFNHSCTLASRWSAEMKSLAAEIRRFSASSGAPVRRVARTIPIVGTLVGRVTNWCCGVITEEQTNFLQTNDQILQRSIKDLSAALSVDHSQFLNITHNMETFAQSTTASLNAIHNEISKEQDALREINDSIGHLLLQVSLTHAHFHIASLRIQRLQSLLHSCSARHLSQDAVDIPVLTVHLQKLATFLLSQNSELAIPFSSPHLYYTEKLTSCVLTGTDFHITIQVPVRKLAPSWKITHLVPVAFKWLHHICRVFTGSVRSSAKQRHHHSEWR